MSNSSQSNAKRGAARTKAPSASVRVENLTKTFGNVPALSDLSLQVAASEMLVLVGPSGCGKTTCLRCLAGLERSTSGRILIGDRVVTAIEEGIFIAPENRQIGMVFQSYAVWPHMTVFENIAYPLRAMGTPRNAIKPRVEEALRLVRLGNLAERYSSQLSGGQQQRVALARSLVAEPALLLFDEPLSNLDANLRTQMRVEIKELQKKLGFTGVYVTHDQAEALAIADRVAVMQGGLLRQIGTPREVYDHPANTFVAGFMGATNLLKGTVRAQLNGEAKVEMDGGFLLRVADAPSFKAGDAVTVSARPESLTLLPSAHGNDATGLWPADVTLATFIGDTLIYRLRMGPHTLEVRGSPNIVYDVGSPVFIKADPQRCRLLRG
jgi:iron(III) transport system ATP-binding protein